MQTKDFIHIQKVLDGDTAAYSHLVSQYKDMVYTLAFSILKQETEAEDAAQESFIKAYQKLRTFKKDSKFSTWLYTITYRTAIYNLRHRKPMTELPAEEVIGKDTSISQLAQLTQNAHQNQRSEKLRFQSVSHSNIANHKTTRRFPTAALQTQTLLFQFEKV